MLIGTVCHRVPICEDDGLLIDGPTICGTVGPYNTGIKIADENEQALASLAAADCSLCADGCFSRLEFEVHEATCLRAQKELAGS